LVSVIVPTRNSRDTIAICLSSVKAQTYPEIEVLVVDDCSYDGTAEIAQVFEAKVIKRKTGRSEARNVGALRATGNYFLFLDSDMELTPHVVEECVAKIKKGFDAVVIPEISVGIGFWANCKSLEKLCYIDDETIEAARVFERELFEAVNGFDEELEAGEDWDLNHRVKEGGFRIGRVHALIKHNEGSLTLWETMRKKYRYGKTIEKYRNKHPHESKFQLRVIRPAFLRNRRRLLREPVVFIGMIFMKSCEFAAAALGTLSCKFRSFAGQIQSEVQKP